LFTQPLQSTVRCHAFLAACWALALACGCGKSASDDDAPDAGTASSWSACAVNSECVLAPSSCCSPCGKPGLSDVDAINQARSAEHGEDVCPSPTSCPACATELNPDLHATCDGSRCRALDIRAQDASACTADDDCRVRATGCCECGGVTDAYALIAINTSEETLYSDLVCDPGRACPACAPVYPAGVTAVCAADGHCAVQAGAP